MPAPQLNDKDIVAVAKLLMDKFKIRELGLNLNLNAADVDSILENNKDNINEAAYKVLHKWFQGQSGRTTAYVNLVQALHGSDLSMIVSDAFGNKSAYRIEKDKIKKLTAGKPTNCCVIS